MAGLQLGCAAMEVIDLRNSTASAGCNSQSEIYNLRSLTGVLAQLVERLNGIEEVTGSNPVGSTPFYSKAGQRPRRLGMRRDFNPSVFNELARLIRDRFPDTNYRQSQSPLLFSFFLPKLRMSIRRRILNFYAESRLTFGKLRGRIGHR